MRKVWFSVIVCSLLVLGGLPVSAGSGTSNTVLKDVHSFKVSYGSTESGDYSLINYIDVEVSVPGARISDTIWTNTVVNPDTTRSTISSPLPNTQKNFGFGLASSTQRWRVYTPSSASNRIRVRRGANRITVTFTYAYINWFSNPNGCHACGTATATVTVR